LEEIATRIERHLLAAVKRRLMARESCELLATWEQFRQLADQGTAWQRSTYILTLHFWGEGESFTLLGFWAWLARARSREC